MSTIIDRLMDTETVTLEAQSGTFDGQGKPGFSAAVSLLASVRRTDAYVIDAEGSKILTPLTLYMKPGQAAVPGEGDVIRLAGGDEFTVREITDPRRIGAARAGDPDHYRVRCTRGGN